MIKSWPSLSGISVKIVIGTAILYLIFKISELLNQPTEHAAGPRLFITHDGFRNYAIRTTWDGKDVGHEPMKVSLKPADDGSCTMEVSGPFFDSPSPPQGPKGPFDMLWEYEVVEAFFLNDKNQYLEVELGPHGHHLLLMLDGVLNSVKDKLALNYTAEIHGDRWKGTAHLPRAYFPPGVTKFNAYAIHGETDDRKYEALYPASGTTTPNFHALQFFQAFDMSKVLNNYNPNEISVVWKPFVN